MRGRTMALYYDRAAARDLRRLIRTLADVPATGISALRLADQSGVGLARVQRLLEGWREFFTPVPRPGGHTWRLNPAGEFEGRPRRMLDYVARQISLMRWLVNFAGLAVLLFFLTILWSV